MVTCPGCGKVFARIRRTQVYCTRACRFAQMARSALARKTEHAADKVTGMTRAQAREVRLAMTLPPEERWPGSKSWTPAQRHLAQSIEDRQETEGRKIDSMAADSRGRGW